MSIISDLSAKNYIDIKIFSNIMSSFYLDGNLKIAVAVSGGSDSLCLALLLKYWSKESKANITAIIVNHKLRANINEEIEQVKQWLQQYKINTVTLTISDINIYSKIQQNARKERYKVLLEYCKNNNIAYLAIGHHFNDLIETFVMRKKRGISIWGNSSISLVKNFKNTLVIRPLLFFTKQAIQSTLEKMNQCWIEDPSNQNTKFERVIIRNQLGKLNKQQINYYSTIINNFRNDRIRLERECLVYLSSECNITKFGEVVIKLSTFLKLELNIQIAAIGIIIKFISNKEYMPKITKLKLLIKELKKNVLNRKKKYTLGGALIKINYLDKNIDTNYSNLDNTYIKFVRESRGIYDKIKIKDICNNELIWDNRFLIRNINHFSKNYFFAKLNISEYNYLCKVSNIKKFSKKFFLEQDSLLALPWIFNEENKPIASWINNLLDAHYVKFSPTNDLLNDVFYNFSIAKVTHLD